MQLRNGQFLLGDTFERMAELPAASVDMVLCDLPYGTTQNKWDSVLPLDALWREYWRICRGAVVLTAAQPFTSALVMSQPAAFKYAWVWRKSLKTGFLNAKRQPLRQHEDVLVFCAGAPPYFPQMKPELRTVSGGNGKTKSYGEWGEGNKNAVKEHQGFPASVLDVANQNIPNGHPTQKPVALFEYLIRTYTNPGDVVLDNTAGSGTTAIAAINADRRWICIEREPAYYWPAIARVLEHVPPCN